MIIATAIPSTWIYPPGIVSTFTGRYATLTDYSGSYVRHLEVKIVEEPDETGQVVVMLVGRDGQQAYVPLKHLDIHEGKP